MSLRALSLVAGGFCAVACMIAGSHAAGGAQSHGQEDKYVPGEWAIVNGSRLSTWARVNGAGRVSWVGMTMPLQLVQNQPQIPGAGPAGAIAALDFPSVVQETTYFNHVEIHSNPNGHVSSPEHQDANRYRAPHFDVHLFGIPEALVWQIPRVLSGLPHVPHELLPVGWTEPHNSVGQMGRHGYPLADLADPEPWTHSMLVGFLPDASYMHFIEPMLTREFLLRRENFTLPIPTPDVLGRNTQYPTEFLAQYDRELDAYHFIYKGFEPIQ